MSLFQAFKLVKRLLRSAQEVLQGHCWLKAPLRGVAVQRSHRSAYKTVLSGIAGNRGGNSLSRGPDRRFPKKCSAGDLCS